MIQNEFVRITWRVFDDIEGAYIQVWSKPYIVNYHSIWGYFSDVEIVQKGSRTNMAVVRKTMEAYELVSIETDY